MGGKDARVSRKPLKPTSCPAPSRPETHTPPPSQGWQRTTGTGYSRPKELLVDFVGFLSIEMATGRQVVSSINNHDVC